MLAVTGRTAKHLHIERYRVNLWRVHQTKEGANYF
jgi:hypothetical protein